MKEKLAAFWIRITLNRKQFGVLCSLVAIGLLLWARLIIASDMPKMAIADPADERPVVPEVSDKHERPVLQVKLDAVPRSDPFQIDEARFPRPTTTTENGREPPKSPGGTVEDSKRVEALKQRALQAGVNSMSLDVVMLSASLVVIDGRRYPVGASVQAREGEQRYVVAEVRQRSVVLEAEGRRFELKMSNPGY